MDAHASSTTRRDSFVPRSLLLSDDDVRRAVRRMAHEVVERVRDIESLVVLGLQTGGVAFADLLADVLADITSREVLRGTLDVSFYRDDVGQRPFVNSAASSVPVDLSDRLVLLVDDVLFTGRTIRSALNALGDFGRPRAVQLAVMVDRGHRELPIRPDYVGKNLPTSLSEEIIATVQGVWIGTRSEA
ncbi:MAG: bifunctional pyr operon transcriptional regulator/uracil phosphoribosyltransferase PyrR [Actinomycetota bacterium]|nr:bifunctional pyr operon transcriptional regulator/uracil phosphoribosyltransferase PyrR [Actinomycetota bacterium]